MQCSNCGNQVDPASGQCVCGVPIPQAVGAGVPVQRPVQPISALRTGGFPAAGSFQTQGVAVPHSAPPAHPVQPAQATQRYFARPPGYPTFVAWLMTGMFRNWRGALGALIAAWFNLPLAVFGGGLGLVVGGIAGYVGGFSGGNELGSEYIVDVPVFGTMLKSVLLQSGGFLGALAGAVLGCLAGFLGGLLLPWAALADEQGTAVGVFLGQLIVAVFFGVLYTVYRIAAEGWWFRIAGCREPSRREKELLLPILADCAMRLRLNGYPKLLIDDSREPNAACGTRHIVVNRGLLDEFDYEPEPIAAVLCHELTHWRNADAVSGVFVRGLALPLYLAYAVVTWLQRMFQHPVVSLILFVSAWPLLLTIRYFVMPMQAAGSRAAEYLADQGAIRAGHLTGLRQTLSRFRQSFDGARNGWDLSVCATHPPNELRLERAEAPGSRYPLPDPDSPARPLPVVVSSSLTRD